VRVSERSITIISLFYYFFVFSLFFSEFAQSVIKISYITYYDELLLLLFVVVSLWLTRGSVHRLFLYPLVVFLAGILFSIIGPFFDGFEKVIVQSVLNFKLFILWVLLFIFFRRCGYRDQRKILFYLWLISVCGFLINFIYPASFYGLLKTDDAVVRERFGSLRIEGLQLKPNDLAIFMSFYCFYLVDCIKNGIGRKWISLFCLFISLFVIVFTGSRVGIIGFFLAIISGLKVRSSSLLPLLIVLPGIVIMFSLSKYGVSLIDSIVRDLSHFENIEESKYIRGIMIYYGTYLAAEYFPIGVGAGNFGTVYSEGSAVYDYLGISQLEFFQNFWGIFDSNYASLVGEYGFLLFVCMVFIFYRYISLFGNLVGLTNQNISRRLAFLIFSFSLIILLSNPLFMHHYTALSLFIVMLGLVGNRRINLSYEGIIST